MLEVYTLPQIKEAVDIAIGDDGFRSKEVVEILKTMDREKSLTVNDIKGDVLKLIHNVDSLEQRIINIDSKYKLKFNEVMLILEEITNERKNNKQDSLQGNK